MYFDNYEPKIREKFNKIRKYITFSILACAILAITYFSYWILVVNNDLVLDYTAKFFEPLANILAPFSQSCEKYRTTSFVCFGLIFALTFLNGFMNNLEEKLLKAYDKKIEIKQAKQKIEQKIAFEKQFDNIKQYSICLSLDYKTQNTKALDENFKRKLNKTILSSFEKHLNKIDSKTNFYTQEAMIITSNDFEGYDKIYSNLLAYLGKTQKLIKEKYNLEMIPSLTTDAYISSIDLNKIQQQHFNIQNCNFKNKACSTATFSKKYNHIKKSKYLGIPIGEYAFLDDKTTQTYELNIIYKNLGNIISQLA